MHTREILASETFSVVCDDETQKRPKKKTNVKVFWRQTHQYKEIKFPTLNLFSLCSLA